MGPKVVRESVAPDQFEFVSEIGNAARTLSEAIDQCLVYIPAFIASPEEIRHARAQFDSMSPCASPNEISPIVQFTSLASFKNLLDTGKPVNPDHPLRNEDTQEGLLAYISGKPFKNISVAMQIIMETFLYHGYEMGYKNGFPFYDLAFKPTDEGYDIRNKVPFMNLRMRLLVFKAAKQKRFEAWCPVRESY